MTSLGFEDSLNPYKITRAEIAGVLKGGTFITEKNVFDRVITEIRDGCVIGYIYFDFGEDFGSRTMEFTADTNGMGCDCHMHIFIDGEDGEEIGVCDIGKNGGAVNTVVKNVTDRHSVFFKISTDYADDWTGEPFKNRCLFELKSFVFMK